VLELFGTASCPYTAQLREDLAFRRRAYVEYDVERDAGAFTRLLQLRGGDRTVPVLVEDGRVVEVGYQGRGCYAGAGA
jgi:glutaredoxin